MDEPFGAVDPITRSTLQDELLRLQTELRKTIVFVTHDFGEAVKLGDRIAVLGQQSKVLQYDTPQTILASPADDTVAGFVGSGASLRQLGLLRVKDVELRAHPAVHRNDSLESVPQSLAKSDFDWVVVLDDRDRPVNWVRERRLRHAGPWPMPSNRSTWSAHSRRSRTHWRRSWRSNMPRRWSPEQAAGTPASSRWTR